MNEEEARAFGLGQQAAGLSFEWALRGLLAGHAEAVRRMQERLAEKDMAFLMALALTEKGARLDRSGVMEAAIAKGLRGLPHAETERRFLARVDGGEG